MNGKSLAEKYSVFSWNSKIGPNAIALNFSRSGARIVMIHVRSKRVGLVMLWQANGFIKPFSPSWRGTKRTGLNGF